jgi:DNA-binding transcriptional ArsR family regulator
MPSSASRRRGGECVAIVRCRSLLPGCGLLVPGFQITSSRDAIALDCVKHSSIRRRIKQTLLHGLFPVVRAEVLRLLFANPGQELYTRELARLSFLALRTVQDELAKLEAAELIVSRSNGYQRFYRANPKHPLHRAIKEIIRTGVAHPRTNPRLLPSRRLRRVKPRRA